MKGISGEITLNRVEEIVLDRASEIEAHFLPHKQMALIKLKCRQNSSSKWYQAGYFLYCVKVSIFEDLYRLEHLPNQPFFKRDSYMFKYKDQLYYMDPRNLENEIKSLYEKFGEFSALSRIRLNTHDLFRLDFKYTQSGSIDIVSTLCSGHEFEYLIYLNDCYYLRKWLGKSRFTEKEKEALQVPYDDKNRQISYCKIMEFVQGPSGILLLKINKIWRIIRI